jgi:hypothetical protein
VNTDVASAKPKVRARNLILGGLALIVVALFVLHLRWVYSGSAQWELAGERGGVTLYSRKLPGTGLKRFKAIDRVAASLSSVVAAMRDNDIGPEVGFVDGRDLEGGTPHLFYTSFHSPMPLMFKTREYVVKNVLTQDPQTKEVLFIVTAAPDRLPPDPCCVRVTKMDNSWRLTPQENGEVQIEWAINMDAGGFAPYFLLNQAYPDFMYQKFPVMTEIMRREKYRNVKLDYIKNVGEP